MKFKAKCGDIKPAVLLAANVADKNGPMPILHNVLIDSAKDGVILRACDQTQRVTVAAPAAVLELGTTTVPADTLRDIVKLYPDDAEVSFSSDGGRVKIKVGSDEFKIMALPADEYPQHQAPGHTTRFTVKAFSLLQTLGAVLYAVPAKDHRKVLTGVCLALNGNTLTAIGTDGKKLAKSCLNLPEVEGVSKATIIVPPAIVENVVRSVDPNEQVSVSFSDRDITFSFGSVSLTSTLIEGKYPDVDAVIPKEFAHRIVMNREAFIKALRRAGVAADEKSKSVVLIFEDNKCSFHSERQDLGAFSGSVAVEYGGPGIGTAFSFALLMETLDAIDIPGILMLIKNPTAPVVFKKGNDATDLHLLMPIKVTDASQTVSREAE